MPQQNMSSKIGKSSSPTIQRVVDNSKAGQVPVTSPASGFNKKPVNTK